MPNFISADGIAGDQLVPSGSKLDLTDNQKAQAAGQQPTAADDVQPVPEHDLLTLTGSHKDSQPVQTALVQECTLSEHTQEVSQEQPLHEPRDQLKQEERSREDSAREDRPREEHPPKSSPQDVPQDAPPQDAPPEIISNDKFSREYPTRKNSATIASTTLVANDDVIMSDGRHESPDLGVAAPFVKFGITWNLPQIPWIEAPNSKEPPLHVFEGWYRQFMKLNAKSMPVLQTRHDLPLEAFRGEINRYSSEQWGSRPSKSLYRSIAREFSDKKKERLMDILREELDDAPSPKSEERLPQKTDREALELRAYFPSVAETAIVCIHCGSSSHRAEQCGLKTCIICGEKDGGHTSFGCPGLGRSRQSDAASAKAEASATCPICASKAHSSSSCPRLWCSYTPSPQTARKVKHLPEFCYFCGNSGHLGGDCALNHGEHISGRHYSLEDDIWSARHRSLFIDESSANLSIEARSCEGTGKGKGAKTLAGSGSQSLRPRSMVPASVAPRPPTAGRENDSADAPFIRKRVQGQQRPQSGGIKFAGFSSSALAGPPSGNGRGSGQKGQHPKRTKKAEASAPAAAGGQTNGVGAHRRRRNRAHRARADGQDAA